MQSAPASFLLRQRLWRLAAWPRQAMGSRLYYGTLGVLGVGSLLVGGKFLCDSLERSSSLARQTLLNLQAHPQCQQLLGSGPLRIEGGLHGDLNMIGGHAKVNFIVFNPQTGSRAQVELQARRHYLDWQTQSLLLSTADSTVTLR